MDPDDILDDMSLSSDDEMLEDMLNEMKHEVKAPTVTRRQPPVRAAPLAVSRNQPQAGMPDLSKMMSQMMPMMSQMFGNMNTANQGSKKITRAMEDIIADHVPSWEIASWVETIQKDEARQRDDHAKNSFRNNLSRSYRTKVDPMPTANLKASTLLQELLIIAVRNAKCSTSPSWEKNHLTLYRDIEEQGIDRIYADELKTLLKQRVQRDPDYTADPSRFPNISSTVMT